MRFLGVDMGTSAVKLCLIDPDGDMVAITDAPLITSHPFSGASEQHPEIWMDALRLALLDLPEAERDQIAGIGLSGQMHGAVFLDPHLEPIRPAILWNDGRSEAECSEMANEMPEIGQIASVPPMPGFTAPKLRWLAKHAPEDHARIRHVVLPKDYVGLRLHGRCITDPSDAAGTHWLDQASATWSQRLCEVSATDPAWLPKILPGNAVAGHVLPAVARQLGLPPGIPVAAGAGDAAAGAIGIGATEAGDGFVSLGTSGQLFVTTDSYRPNPESRVHSYAHTLPDLWFQMACMLNGARPMAWLSEVLQRPIPDLLAEAAQARPGPLFLPYLTGERTPHGDTEIRAGFWGLGEDTNHGGLMRAVMEAIAFSFADAAEALKQAGTRPERLLAVGGGTRSDLLLQMICDVIDIPIGRSSTADVGPALGAARLAQMAAGGASRDQVACKPDVSTWFMPDRGAAAQMAPRLAAYRQLYPALKSVSATLAAAQRD